MEKTGRAAPFEGNQATKMGHLLEPVVANLYRELHPEVVDLIECETIVGKEPWMLATPDRVAHTADDREWLVEIKNRSRFTIGDFGEQQTDQVPHDILCQVLWQQYVTGLTGDADVAVLVDGRDFMTFTVPYDAELAAMLVRTLRDWWTRHVVQGIEPAIDQTAIEYLKAKFPANNTEVLAADETSELLLEELRIAKQLADQADRLKDNAKAALMEIMGEAGGLRGEAGSVSWRTAKGRSVTDWEAIADEVARAAGLSPEDYSTIQARHVSTLANQRVFRFTASKKVEVTGAETLGAGKEVRTLNQPKGE
jgi:predicted phage-related endonuclease